MKVTGRYKLCVFVFAVCIIAIFVLRKPTHKVAFLMHDQVLGNFANVVETEDGEWLSVKNNLINPYTNQRIGLFYKQSELKWVLKHEADKYDIRSEDYPIVVIYASNASDFEFIVRADDGKTLWSNPEK